MATTAPLPLWLVGSVHGPLGFPPRKRSKKEAAGGKEKAPPSRRLTLEEKKDGKKVDNGETIEVVIPNNSTMEEATDKVVEILKSKHGGAAKINRKTLR